MPNAPTILVVDDDRAVCASLRLLLGRAGFGVSLLYHPRELEGAFAKTAPDLVVLDMNFTVSTTGRAGLEALREIRRLAPRVPVILVTGWATVQLAVEGMKLGAVDFLAKPWDNKQLLGSVRAQLALRSTERDAGADAGADAGQAAGFEAIVGDSDAMRRVLDVARRVADTDAGVLITGESGTGKEVLAEALHLASARAEAPFAAMNLGGVPEALFESELFGHRAGAFTDARADRRGRIAEAEGGTLFLDEVGDTPAAAQVKLLRVLQERRYEVLGDSRARPFDARVICATHRDLPAMVAAGTFREDLFYRINLVQLHLPPLRERGRDVVALAGHFLRTATRKHGRGAGLRLSPKLADYLLTLQLPGNVRQLGNLVERAVLLHRDADGPELTVDEVSAQLTGRDARASAAALDEMTLAELEETAVRRALARHPGHGQVAAAARDLGISRTALYRRMERYGLGET